MARARNIKPGFFTNDLLAEVPPMGRLLFAGLWTLADREGRLEDRSKRIKAQILPYDLCDVEDLLQHLARRGFIQRYATTSGSRYIQVKNWAKHQQPHVKESPSTIPAPDEHGASTVQAPDEPGIKTPDSLNLIPLTPVPVQAPGEKQNAPRTDPPPAAPVEVAKPRKPKTEKPKEETNPARIIAPLPDDWQALFWKLKTAWEERCSLPRNLTQCARQWVALHADGQDLGAIKEAAGAYFYEFEQVKGKRPDSIPRDLLVFLTSYTWQGVSNAAP